MKTGIRRVALVIACAVASVAWANKSSIGFKFEADHSDCLYKLGEEAVIVVTATNGAGEAVREGCCRVDIDNFGGHRFSTIANQDFSKENPFTVRGTMMEPGFLRVNISGEDPQGRYLGCWWGVGYEPEKIRPASARPVDFDVFWDTAIAKFEKEVPFDVTMVLDEQESKSSHDCYRLTFATVPKGRVIRGTLTIPKGDGPWPIMMTVPGAGLGSWGFTRKKDRAFLTLNVVDYPCWPDKEKSSVEQLYAEQNKRWGAKTGPGTANWYFHGDLSRGREDFFYYGAILGINRGVDWVSVLPRIQPHSVWYYGQSQGGAFGIYLSALNKNIVRAGIGEPAITDLCGKLVDRRQGGWPTLPEQYAGRPFYDNMMAILPYFDCVHFVPRIKVPTRWFVGFVDALCPPHAVWAGYNCLRTTDKRMQNWPGLGHGTPSQLYQKAFKEWQESW